MKLIPIQTYRYVLLLIPMINSCDPSLLYHSRLIFKSMHTVSTHIYHSVVFNSCHIPNPQCTRFERKPTGNYIGVVIQIRHLVIVFSNVPSIGTLSRRVSSTYIAIYLCVMLKFKNMNSAYINVSP